MKILIVDDDPQNRDILRTRLEQAGHEVSEADNGESGYAAALEGDFDLFILDVMMPKKDGWEICKSLKAHTKTQGRPVIVLTARIQPIDELRSFESGADEYLTKPVDHKQLLDSIDRLAQKGAQPH